MVALPRPRPKRKPGAGGRDGRRYRGEIPRSSVYSVPLRALRSQSAAPAAASPAGARRPRRV